MTDLNNILKNVREDDFIEYFLFPNLSVISEAEEETFLSTLLEECNKIIQEIAKDHLWHKDKLELVCRSTNMNKLNNIDSENVRFPPHLYGVTHFGENIEDEWLIVYIIFELTKRISGLIGRVCDADGEFLLIEAAEYVPNWANPDTANQRVFLYEGKIHIIQPEFDEEVDSKIDVFEAVSIILKNSQKTEASTDVQNAIADRISVYPENIKRNLHTAKVYLPIGIAAILKYEPNLISPVVYSFCNRDTIDMKVCSAKKYFPPENRVYTNVVFTKCLYAMLTHSKFIPDRRTGWNLPNCNNKEFKSHNLGVKIACGFEILASQARPSQDLDSDRAWQNYLKSLRKKNYFGDLLEHSREYNNLMNKAKEHYIKNRDSMYYSPLIGQKILKLMKTLEYSIDDFKNAEKDLHEEEDDSWLNINPEELDEYLRERYGKKKTHSFNSSSDASKFSQKINSFLNHVSDINGAEFPNTESPVKPPRSKKSKETVTFTKGTTQTESGNKINFDADAFGSAIQNILNFGIPEDDNWDLESDSGMSDYEDDIFVKNNSIEESKTQMTTYMDEMDKELAQTTIGESFIKKNGENFEDVENFRPVDIDMNALKNILESYKSQLGEAGPSSNMLGPMGVYLDIQEDKS
ncbi:hypothetical protein WA026_002741 [Henosepilachna vigintioctopunctata]|uniref:Uncharacterized protein n=1 Tax=Henosepilachna vigintioctopunctata TaxID=420089 RepID=A0AAW1U4U1_9CUCU